MCISVYIIILYNLKKTKNSKVVFSFVSWKTNFVVKLNNLIYSRCFSLKFLYNVCRWRSAHVSVAAILLINDSPYYYYIIINIRLSLIAKIHNIVVKFLKRSPKLYLNEKIVCFWIPFNQSTVVLQTRMENKQQWFWMYAVGESFSSDLAECRGRGWL